MINRSFFLLTFLLLASPVKALMVDIPHNEFTSNTNTHTPIELKPTSFLELDKVYKVASVCFLGEGDCNFEGGFTSNNDMLDVEGAEQCLNEGFSVTSCTLPEFPSQQCPYNESHFLECKIDNARACLESGYVTSCPGSQALDNSKVCPYDNSYYKCSCNPCDGFEYTQAEATAEGYVADGSCESCNETKYKRKCAVCDGYDYTYEQATAEGYVEDGSCKTCEQTMYKRKVNPCEGYLTCECGGEIGTQTCQSGTVEMYQVCKPCCENKCTEETCPAGSSCELETCSNKYCITGCATGNTEWCTQPVTDCGTLGYTKTPDQCVDGYLKCPYGDTVFCEDNEVTKDDTCPANYSKESCTSSQVEQATATTEAGSKCYSCKEKTCSDYNASYTPSPTGQYDGKQAYFALVDKNTVGGLTCYNQSVLGCYAGNCGMGIPTQYTVFNCYNRSYVTSQEGNTCRTMYGGQIRTAKTCRGYDEKGILILEPAMACSGLDKFI